MITKSHAKDEQLASVNAEAAALEDKIDRAIRSHRNEGAVFVDIIGVSPQAVKVAIAKYTEGGWNVSEHEGGLSASGRITFPHLLLG